jgi:hypothetical protein
MPTEAQNVTLTIAVAFLIGFLLYASFRSVKEKSALPLLYFVAGFCTILLEPLVTHMGHAVHPEIGQLTLFKSADRAIPWHIATIYSFYFGAVYLFVLPHLLKPGVTSSFVWKTYFCICAFAYLIEIVPMHYGLWIYYDNQALWLWKGGMPLFWTFVNSASILFPMALMKLMQSSITGVKQLLVIPLSVMGANMAHFGAGVLFYNATNSGASDLIVELSGLGSVALAFLLVHICILIIARQNEVRVGSAALSKAREGRVSGGVAGSASL